MYIFQSEQLNIDSDLKITSLIFNLPDLNPLDLDCRLGAILWRYICQNRICGLNPHL